MFRLLKDIFHLKGSVLSLFLQQEAVIFSLHQQYYQSELEFSACHSVPEISGLTRLLSAITLEFIIAENLSELLEKNL